MTRLWRLRARLSWFTTILAVLIVLVAIALMTHPIWLPALYTHLNEWEPPQNADVIVVLGGDEGSRGTHAAELYHQTYADRILISGGSQSANDGLSVVLQHDVPEDAIIINDQATSTHDEAGQVLDILLDMDAESALIVTNAFHTRRASATYAHVFREHDIALTIVASDADEINASSWWRTERAAAIAAEYPKMLYYWIVYGIWSG